MSQLDYCYNFLCNHKNKQKRLGLYPKYRRYFCGRTPKIEPERQSVCLMYALLMIYCVLIEQVERNRLCDTSSEPNVAIMHSNTMMNEPLMHWSTLLCCCRVRENIRTKKNLKLRNYSIIENSISAFRMTLVIFTTIFSDCDKIFSSPLLNYRYRKV